MSVTPRASFDYVCADLRCPACGEYAMEPCAIDLQTKVADRPELRSLRVGDQIDVADNLSEAYLRVGASPEHGMLRVIEAWTCARCGSGLLWARLTIRGGVLQLVEPVHLTAEVLRVSDFITPEALFLASGDRMSQLAALPPEQLRFELAKLDAELRQEQRHRPVPHR